MGAHTHAHQGNLHHPIVAYYPFGAHAFEVGFQDFHGLSVIVAMNSKGEIQAAFARHVLHDHVHHDIGVGDGPEYVVSRARLILDADERDLRFIAVEGDTRDDGGFHGDILISDERALAFFEGGQYPQGNIVFAGELHGADLQHLGTQARQLQHFLEGDTRQAARFRHHARIGGIDAVHVGVNLAFIKMIKFR